MSDPKKTPVTWIIGASQGIGKALAEQYYAEGHRLILSGRNEETLNTVKCQLEDTPANSKSFKHSVVDIVPLDMTDMTSIDVAKKRIDLDIDYIDRVIINGGTCEYINSMKIDMASVRDVMETNFFGVINIVNAALPLLRKAKLLNESNDPQLVFMSSSVSYQALPRAGAYGGSKAALRYLAEAMQLDLQYEGLDVRVISPGFVKTPLTDKNDFSMPGLISAESAAKRIIKGLKGSQFDIRFPKRFIWPLLLVSILPFKLRSSLVGKLSRHQDALNKVAQS